MKILYLDLNHHDLIEDYSRFPNVYGGGRCVPAELMPYLNDNGHYCEIWGDLKCFQNVEEKYKPFCKELSYLDKESLRKGSPLLNWSSDFDIVLHNFHGSKINCQGVKTKDAVWLVGYGEHVNSANSRIILYNDYQHPKIYNQNTKIYKARIGVPIPEFQEYKKEDFIFSCHRQTQTFGAEEMMHIAHKHQLKYITSGPKDSSFPDIMEFVDNQHVKYLGVIDESTKIEHFKRAYCSVYLHSWQTPMNLSACQALSYGTPIIANNIGFWSSLVKNGENGFLVSSEDEFLEALKNVTRISQKSCYNSVLEYSSDVMVQEYVKVFEQILNENN